MLQNCRATSVYFKSLYSASEPVKAAAFEGLRIVLTHQARLPKELLQTGLRPILMNLADPKRITASGLEGLAKLLELLKNYFKVEIGIKLLEHYASIGTPDVLQAAAFLPISGNEDVLKLVMLVNIFYLLPQTANQYAEQLISLVVGTEALIVSAAPTPLTPPISKYADRYAPDCAELCIRMIDQPQYVRTFRNILQLGEAPDFAQALIESMSKLITERVSDSHSPVTVLTLKLCLDLIKYQPDWLKENPAVYLAFLQLWRDQFAVTVVPGMEPPSVLSQQPPLLLSIFLTHLEQNQEGDNEIELLFDLVTIYAVRIATDLSRLTQFLYQRVATSKSATFKHAVFLRFMEKFENTSIPWAQKTQFLRLVINPMLLVAVTDKEGNEGLVDGEIMARVQNHVWKVQPNATAADTFPGADDNLKIQLLHMSTTLIQLALPLMHDSRKDLIKYSWLFITAEDMFVRQMAHVLTARFFEYFEAPPKFVTRVWGGLLRPAKESEKNVEDRTLTRAALDILAPILSKRLPLESWVRQTKFVLLEEGHTVSALVHIYQVVVTHPDVFYECREFLVPHMAISLGKIGLNTSAANNDSRTLTLDIIDLVLAWERRQTVERDAMDVSSDGEAGPRNWAAPLTLRENVVSYLLRFITNVTPDPPSSKSGLISRAMNILEFVLGPKGWTEVTVKVSFFIKLFNPVSIIYCLFSIGPYLSSFRKISLKRLLR